MKKILIHIGIFVFAVFFGSFVNMGIISLSPYIISPPPGADFTTEEGLKASMSLMRFEHFIFPFLAHALGTLAATMIIGLLAKEYRLILTLLTGALFFTGGLYMVMILPSPMWFNLTDLTLSYFPMAFSGLKLSEYLIQEKK